MAKHGENIKKRKDGRYEARYIKSRDVTGNVVWASVYGKTYREAKEKREDLLIQKKLSEMLKINDVLFVDIIESFLIQEKFRVKESTFAHYKNIIDAHIWLLSKNQKYIPVILKKAIPQKKPYTTKYRRSVQNMYGLIKYLLSI